MLTNFLKRLYTVRMPDHYKTIIFGPYEYKLDSFDRGRSV